MSQIYLPGMNPLTGYQHNPQGREIITDVFLFGGGLDSLTILSLICDNVLPIPEIVIWSDTAAEPDWVHLQNRDTPGKVYDLICQYMSVRWSHDPVYDTLFGTCHGSPPF